MSTSELRRGPGWWMDLEGQWNPPEEWPEETPPLPGWTRNAEGVWEEPAVADERSVPQSGATPAAPALDLGNATVPSLDSLTDDAVVRVVPERRAGEDRRAAPTKSESILTFAEATAHIGFVDDEDFRDRQKAIMAAALAAVTASMLAAGLVLLLLLL